MIHQSMLPPVRGVREPPLPSPTCGRGTSDPKEGVRRHWRTIPSCIPHTEGVHQSKRRGVPKSDYFARQNIKQTTTSSGLVTLELTPAPVECFLIRRDLEVTCIRSSDSKGLEVVSFCWDDLQRSGFQAPLTHVE